MKRTKIIATIGPASEGRKVLTKIIEDGTNVARLNFSHSDFAWHGRVIREIRKIGKKMKRPIGIMADLQGPRIRIANGKDQKVKRGEIVRVGAGLGRLGKLGRLGEAGKIIFLDLPEAVRLAKLGNEILIEDGLIKLKVIGKNGKFVKCEAMNEGIIKPKKGVNIPGISAKIGALTQKDKEVLDFILSQDVDFVAMSFVRSAGEIGNLKKLIKKKTKNHGRLPQVIAKIERREAVKNFDEILRAADAIMVARGDLGIEMPQEEIPILQKEMTAKSLRAGKPAIVATQMLDSMIRNPRPTRAEVTDVANAVVDHADAVMLSGETASGKYPVEAVRTMRQIIEKTEESPFDDLGHGFLGDQTSSVSAAVAQSAHELLKDSGAKAIVVASVSGFTARMITRHRPEQEVFVMTNNEKTSNQLTLVWGVESFILPDCRDLDELLDRSIETLKKNKVFKKGDRVVIVAGRPHVKREHMSLVKIEEIK
ncbi:MAG: pyruvate kinase [Candidatus Moranbacteria bacterium CG_4_10_14_3_um_filter_44_15]|nr:MAG: pyruvate kinase [Candidatus Moranbacteria bacterium CG_4_8_14_3_um_filter_43_15]PIX91177.1 MAG: pyruvate kinase [Candidatus Moranbacteria bacterium CG_4_10_14_3_um_filter_44_15]PJA86359.1 MAG: pyruvate kinase [Candidatus Moranbacteria bacterium CG_4_9_14_3_um_filter_44_28]